jgi:hypothetical protein
MAKSKSTRSRKAAPPPTTPRRTRRQEKSYRGKVMVIAIRAFRFAFTEVIDLTSREHPTRTVRQMAEAFVEAMRHEMAELERSVGTGGAQS